MGQDHFQFRHFTIRHDRCAMKVGTDAVIFGAWIELNAPTRILDVGTGSGLIAIMLAQRLHGVPTEPADAHAATGLRIDALEIEGSAWEQACENVAATPWSAIIHPQHTSLQTFAAEPGSYDLVVSCPPYFTRSTQSQDQARNAARHTEFLPPSTLVEAAAGLLHERGQIAVIYPPEEAAVFADSAQANGFFLTRQMFVHGVAHKPAKRIVSQWTRCQADAPARPPVEHLAVETTVRHQMTPEHIALTHEFYLPSHLARRQDAALAALVGDGSSQE